MLQRLKRDKRERRESVCDGHVQGLRLTIAAQLISRAELLLKQATWEQTTTNKQRENDQPRQQFHNQMLHSSNQTHVSVTVTRVSRSHWRCFTFRCLMTSLSEWKAHSSWWRLPVCSCLLPLLQPHWTPGFSCYVSCVCVCVVVDLFPGPICCGSNSQQMWTCLFTPACVSLVHSVHLKPVKIKQLVWLRCVWGQKGWRIEFDIKSIGYRSRTGCFFLYVHVAFKCLHTVGIHSVKVLALT